MYRQRSGFNHTCHCRYKLETANITINWSITRDRYSKFLESKTEEKVRGVDCYLYSGTHILNNRERFKEV